jgi:hypothetical protein
MMLCTHLPLTDEILFASRTACPYGAEGGRTFRIGTVLRLLDPRAADCLDLDQCRGTCPGCDGVYWFGLDGHEDPRTGLWTCGADDCPGAMPADWPAPACSSRVAFAVGAEDLDAAAYAAAVARGVL